MRAITFNEHGGPEVLQYTEDFPMPEINENEVLVKVAYTSLNRVDLVVRKGYPGMQLPLPHILGGDIAGTIVEIGAEVSYLKVGDRVVVYPIVLPDKKDPKYSGNEHLNDGWKYFGMHLKGAYAEYVAVPAENIIRLPNEVKLETAAALPISGLTAYHAIKTVAKLKQNDVFMIWGGSGGFGTLAIQIAKSLGVKVITTTRNEEKSQALKDLGADYVFVYNNDYDLNTKIREIYPEGVDVVLDYVGPATFDQTFAMMRKCGKILFCGMLTGMEIKLNIQQTYLRHLNIHGLYLGSPAEFKEFIGLVWEKKLNPLISAVYPLEKASDAHKLMESGDYIGKILLKL